MGWCDNLFAEVDAVVVFRANLAVSASRIISRHFHERGYSLSSTLNLITKTMPKYESDYVRNYPTKAGARKVYQITNATPEKVEEIIKSLY